ncbi:MAG: GGDEF domain-containing protein, partial [Rhodospirillales bacterium]|nr:GGDEF domain-containing protein [Rhodospirillales bacterium]
MAKMESVFERLSGYVNVSPEQLHHLITVSRHSLYLKRHRADFIASRIRIIAALFAILTLLWIPMDIVVFDATLWKPLALMRGAAVALFVFLA